jgi:hypothetical protein
MADDPQHNPTSASGSCKISSGAPMQYFQVQATDMPVTIQLCEDQQRHPAQSSWIETVEVDLSSTETKAQNQPANITNTTFDLGRPENEPENKKYDVWIKVGHKPGAYSYLYEACSDSPALLCAIDTSVGPTCSFTIEVL